MIELFIELTVKFTSTPGQSISGSNGNEMVLHIPQISRARASPSITV